MTRVALLGMAPLPFEDAKRHHAPGVRCWQFGRPLLRADHRVRIMLRRYPEAYRADVPDVEEISCPEGEGKVILLTPTAFDGPRLSHLLLEEPFDCLMAATVTPAARAAELAGEVPFYADLLGHTMGEGQAKAVIHQDDALLLGYFQQELRILDRADRLSSVSEAHRAAVLGELGLLGRLNASTVGYPFVDVIRCSSFGARRSSSSETLRGSTVPADAFVVFWSGGYNTWADVETLFRGLDGAMEQDASVHFLSTGGELKGQDEETYPRFREMVQGSRYEERFHLLGWIDQEKLPACCRTADVAINVDQDIAESWLGGRNRIPVFQSHGLPVITTPASEVSRDAEAAGAAYLFPPGDAAALAATICRLAAAPEALRGNRERIAAFARDQLSPEATASPVVAFAAHPVRAPDADCTNDLRRQAREISATLDAKDRRIADLTRTVEEAARHIANTEKLLDERDAAIRELRRFEAKVKESRAYRLYRLLRGRR